MMGDDLDNGTEKWRVIMDGLKYIVDVTLKICGVVLLIATVITQPIIMYLNYQNGTKLDTAAVEAKSAKVAVVEKAAEIKSELSNAKAQTDQALTAVAVGVDASVKGWKAYQSKDPEDMEVAARAVVNAERLTEQTPLAAGNGQTAPPGKTP